MPQLIKQTLLACTLALAAGALCATPAVAAPAKRPAAKASAKAKPKAPAEPDASEPEPDITDTITTDFECELGNKVTTYHNVADDAHIAIRWKKRLHRLTRVGTTTGAQRFENPLFGLIWIGIPAKGMLLDSKLNRQLANECKNAEQSKPPAPAPAPEPVPAPAPVSTQVPPAATQAPVTASAAAPGTSRSGGAPAEEAVPAQQAAPLTMPVKQE